AGRWSDTVFAHRPGTRVTAVHAPDGVELRTRGGDVFALRFDPPLPDDHHLAASVLAERMVCADTPPTRESVAALGSLRLRVSAERTVTVGLRPAGDDPVP
ncbi:hypothetical protein, partial [Nocardiopsis protaetiae]